MVRADLKRVTARTNTISNRQAHTKSIRALSRATGQKSRTKEAYTASRKAIVRDTKAGGAHVTYNNLTKRELSRRLRENSGRRVVLVIHADRSGDKYRNKGAVWTHGISQVDADTLLDPKGFNGYLDASNIISKPDRYGLEVLSDE